MRKCIYCGKEPKIIRSGGVYYVQCCNKHNPYEYCGVRQTTAIDSWNMANSLCAKINMEHGKNAGRKQEYYYIVDGERINSIKQVSQTIHCSYKSLSSVFSKKHSNTVILKGHVIIRGKRGQK